MCFHLRLRLCCLPLPFSSLETGKKAAVTVVRTAAVAAISKQQKANRYQNQQKRRVVKSERSQIPQRASVIFTDIKLIRNHARQRGDQRSQPADIHPQRNRPPQIRKRSQKQRRRHIADNLTDSNSRKIDLFRRRKQSGQISRHKRQ